MTPELRRARDAARRLAQAYETRDAAIRAASSQHSYSEIAAATGLSKPRVQQIVSAAT